MSVAILGIFKRKLVAPDTSTGHLAAEPSSDKDSKVDSACGSGSASKNIFQVKTEKLKPPRSPRKVRYQEQGFSVSTNFPYMSYKITSSWLLI